MVESRVCGLAILKFKCKEKQVQLSRCTFVNATEFENRVDMMAQTEDYSKRGLTLPYGYRVENAYDETVSVVFQKEDN